MRSAWMIGVIVSALAAPAWAQPAGAQRERQGGRAAQAPGAGFAAPAELAQQLAEMLNLTPEQRPKYDAVVAKFKPKWDEQAGQREQMRDLMRQMQEARQNGDDAQLEKIQKEVEQLRESNRALMNQFYGEVEPLLTPEQVIRLNDFRERMERGRGGGGLEQLIQRLPADLKLTDAQKPKFDELVAKYRAQAQELRPLRDELRQARQERDTARVADIEKQIAAKGGEESVDSFLAKVDPILTTEQKAKLPELWLRYGTGGGPDDVRAVLQAARRLNLDEQQQARLGELVLEAMRACRTAQTREQRAELGKSVKSKVVALLTAEQAQEFERQLERPQRPERGERRPERP